MKFACKSSRALVAASRGATRIGLTVLGLMAVACSRPAPPEAQIPPAPVVEPLPLAGGWHPAQTDDTLRSVVEAAVGQRASQTGATLQLVAIDALEQQVVAGMNYRALLRIRQGADERRVRVAVFRALDGHVELTAWQWLSVP